MTPTTPAPAPEPSPERLAAVRRATEELGFDASSSLHVARKLAGWAAAKPDMRILELGTGTGWGAAWLLAGMGPRATLTTVELDGRLQEAARRAIGEDSRVDWVVADGYPWIEGAASQGRRFDLIFADSWPGKFPLAGSTTDHLQLTLGMLAPGGRYVGDDLLPQPNWPEGHAAKVPEFIGAVRRQGLRVRVSMTASTTGLLVATRPRRESPAPASPAGQAKLPFSARR